MQQRFEEDGRVKIRSTHLDNASPWWGDVRDQILESPASGKFVEHHPRTKVKGIEGQYLRDQMHSVWTFYDENGAVWQQLEYEHGEQVGNRSEPPWLDGK